MFNEGGCNKHPSFFYRRKCFFASCTIIAEKKGEAMGILTELEPKNVFRYFEEISAIPRGSGDTQAMTEYLVQFAIDHNLDAIADEEGNVIMKKPGSEGYEESDIVILQGHMDMVCAAAPGVAHNFETDPITLAIEDDYITAVGTTLGGDDGIAVAYMLAILDDDTIAHPPLECVFTIDEETGLVGANLLDPSFIDGKRMINLDSEEEGIITTGCAGATIIITSIPVGRAVIKGLPVLVEIGGLKGGHSGADIDKDRINADKLMGRYLYELDRKIAFSLCDVSGGDKDNVIPASSKAHLVIDDEDLEAVNSFTREFTAEVRKEYAGTDDGLTIKLESGHPHKVSVMDPDSQNKVITFLMHIPNGVQHMSGISKGLVQTSTNLGIIKTGQTQFLTTSMIRSSYTSEKDYVAARIRSLTKYLGGSTQVSYTFPAWEYNENSELQKVMADVYEEMNGKRPVINVIHAGLECGIFVSKIEGLDAVSIGPDMIGIHTPDEKLSISSAKRTWDYLLKVLSALK